MVKRSCFLLFRVPHINKYQGHLLTITSLLLCLLLVPPFVMIIAIDIVFLLLLPLPLIIVVVLLLVLLLLVVVLKGLLQCLPHVADANQPHVRGHLGHTERLIALHDTHGINAVIRTQGDAQSVGQHYKIDHHALFGWRDRSLG